MKKTLIIGLSAVAFNAHAATISQSGSFSGLTASTPITIDQLDPALYTPFGTFDSVTVTVNVTATADVTVVNGDPVEKTVTAFLIGEVEAKLPTVATVLDTTTVLNHTDIGTLPASGSVTFNNVGGFSTSSDSITSSLGAFEGTGDVDFTITSSNSWGASGLGNGATATSNASSLVEWTVTYAYTVPEPSTALFGLVGLFGLARRRR